MSEMETEIERRVESEPSGSSQCIVILCESTAVVGSVGGLRGTEKSLQLFGETAAQEQWYRGGTGSAGKQSKRREASSQQQQAAGNSISSTSIVESVLYVRPCLVRLQV